MDRPSAAAHGRKPVCAKIIPSPVDSTPMVTHYCLVIPSHSAMTKLTPAKLPTACQVYFVHMCWSLISHPRAINPLCSQSSSNRMANKREIGAWIKIVSRGR